MKVGFIGAGKVGFSLGIYMVSRGLCLEGYYSRNLASAQAAAQLSSSRAFSSLEEVVAACDCLFITVPDDALAQVWQKMQNFSLQGKLVCHCSGLSASKVFVRAKELGASAYSLHPILALPDKNSAAALGSAYFTLEGDEAGLDKMRTLLAQMGNPYERIEAEKKPLYHAACVSVSNLMNGLAKMGEDLFAECGLDAQFSQNAWHALFLGQAQNIAKMGVVDSLTGPVERGDVCTIATHLNKLSNPEREIYRLLSEKLITIAQEKNPTRDYSLLEKELRQ